MKKNMTLLALAGKCDGRSASGLGEPCPVRGRVGDSLAKNLSCERSPASATPVKPAPASQRNSRRVRRQKLVMVNHLPDSTASALWLSIQLPPAQQRQNT